MDASVEVIGHHLDDFNMRQLGGDIFQQSHVLEGIVQLLIFETAMAQGADWDLHLSAALALFHEIFRQHGMQDGIYHLPSIMWTMHRPSVLDDVTLDVPVWNADQAAFRFFVAYLIYADIVSSTSLGNPPRLRQMHRCLVMDAYGRSDPTNGASAMLQMECYIGCQGWVLLLVGEISALEVWKRSASPLNNENWVEELIRRSKDLEEALQQGLQSIEGPVGPFCNIAQADKHTLVTKTWIHAAMIYLSTVKEGWRLDSQSVRSNVEFVLNILRELPPELCLRSLLWPLCISGFLATTEQEQVFKDFVLSLGPLQAFGAAKETLRLMERVWRLRNNLDRDTWQIADCFKADKNKVLLV